MRVKKYQLKLDMEQQTGSKLGKEYIKAIYCHPAYLTYQQSISGKMLGWMKHNLKSRLLGEITITSDMQMIPPLWQKVKRKWRASWWKWKRRVKKLAWNSIFKKTKIMALHANRWRSNGNSDNFIFLGSKITADGNYIHEIKSLLLLGRKIMTNLDNILKSRDITLLTKVCLVKAMIFPVVVHGCELDHKESWVRKNCCFWTVCWRRLLRVPWTSSRSNQSILKEISPEYSLEGQMLKLKLQNFGHLMWRSDSSDPDAGKDWRQEENGKTGDEVVGCHHWLNGHELEQAQGDGEEQGNLACFSPWGRKE